VHKFKVGETVTYQPPRASRRARLSNASSGHYVVTRLLPERDGELGYQIKGSHESHDRTARKSELMNLAGRRSPCCHVQVGHDDDHARTRQRSVAEGAGRPDSAQRPAKRRQNGSVVASATRHGDRSDHDLKQRCRDAAPFVPITITGGVFADEAMRLFGK
jgi:hypothetical protein